MGETPLVRLTVDSAKIRYRYGAPTCDADVCRKRFRVGASGLKLSVASHDAVQKIVNPLHTSGSRSLSDDRDGGRDTSSNMDNTNRMIARVISKGHHGISEPFHDTSTERRRSEARDRSRGRRRHTHVMHGLGARANWRKRESREMQKKRTLSCIDILRSSSAIIDYVFDEPGPVPHNSTRLSPKLRGIRSVSPEASQEDLQPLPPPVCRVSVLLRGTDISYDVGAVADVERVIERLQPLFYDLLPLAQRVQARDGKRMATGLQLEIDVTPKEPKLKEAASTSPPLLTIPFTPRTQNWVGLSASRVREWRTSVAEQGNSSETSESELPPSQLILFSSGMEIHTEIPFQSGVQQTADISIKDVRVESRGVAEIPLLLCESAKVTKVVHFPLVWNEEHVVTTDITLSSSEIFYVPDSFRIIDDLAWTIQEESKKPSGVNYFVPFREKTKIRAQDNYCVVLSCSRDNAWEDVREHVSDKYGLVKVCGESGEVILSPNVPTEYHADSTVLSWSLSLPNAVGKLELMISTCDSTDQQARKSDLRRSSHVNSESSRAGHQKLRPPSIARRVRSQIELLAGHGHSSSTTFKKTVNERVEFVFARFGKLCKLSGKVIANEDRRYLGTSFPAFLDAVNTNDMNLNTSSLTLDINPFHTSHFLNMVRNYSGAGSNILTTAERAKLDHRRHRISKGIIADGRLPNVRECLVLGLAPGYTLPSSDARTAMDDIIRMSFHVDSFLMRLHALPHALSPFDFNSKDICSLQTSKLLGSLLSNRLGLDLKFSPSQKRNEVIIHSGFVSNMEGQSERPTGSSSARMVPTMVIQKLRIHKRGLSSSEWSSYYSNLRISIAKISGCLLDSTALFLSRMGLSFIPDGISEDVVTVGTLLSVDNIDVDIAKIDLLLLSPSSISAVDRSGQLKVFTRAKEDRIHRREEFSPIPKFLAGVSQIYLEHGFRVVLSSLSSEHEGFRVRVVLPDILIQSFIPCGGKLTPWVDDATLRAQVGHASLTTEGSVQDGNLKIGVLKKAAEIRECTIDILFTSKPLLWSRHVSKMQRSHISQQSRTVRCEVLPWCEKSCVLSGARWKRAILTDDLKAEWWDFLGNARQAAMLSSQLRRGYVAQCRMDSLSIVLVSKVKVFVTPEFLEFTNDVITRSKEFTCQWQPSDAEVEAEEAIRFRHEKLPHDFLTLWHLFENLQPVDLMSVQRNSPATSFQAVETEGLTLSCLAPTLSGDTADNEPYTVPRQGDENVFMSFPTGITVLQTVRTDSSNMLGGDRSANLRNNPTVTRVNVIHTSFDSFVVGCNGQSLGNIEKVVVILRENFIVGPFQVLGSDTRESRRRLRKTIVGRIGSLNMGIRKGSLDMYGTFGRIISVYLLIVRAVNLEVIALGDIQRARLERLCEMMLNSSVKELLNKDANMARGFLTTVIKLIQVRQADRSSQDRIAISDYALPKVSVLGKKGEIPIYSEVNSVDLSLRNFVLFVSDKEILSSDVLTCRGGSTTSIDKPSSQLEGYILNAAVGTLSISIRDDIATETLGIVSTVASFIRRATLSMPILRQDGQWAKPSKTKTSELLSFSYKDDDFVKEAIRGRSSQDHRSPASIRGRGRLGSLRNRSNLTRRRIHHHSHSSRPQGNVRESGSVASSELGRRFSLQVKPFDSKMGFPIQNRDFSFTHTETPGLENFESPRRRERALSNERGRSPPLSENVPNLLFDGNARGGRSNLERDVPLDNNDYAHVAVRTAGESGPPRKRSKCMIPVSLNVPPAFSSECEPRVHRKVPEVRQTEDTETDHTGRWKAEGPSSPVDKDEGVTQTQPEQTSVMSQFPMVSIDRYSAQLRKKRAQAKLPNVTFFLSCKQIAIRYCRARDLISVDWIRGEKVADMTCLVHAPKLTFMSAPEQHSYSLVITASSAKLASSNHTNCSLTGSIAKIGMTISVAQGHNVSTLPRLMASSRVSDFKVTLHAGDLRSVLNFREEFKKDIKALLSAFLQTKHSVSEMTRATRLSSSRVLYPSRAILSAMSFDVLFERSTIRLEGFHPKDNRMSISYVVDGIFFSVMASEEENAALTLGLRVYGHGLRMSSPEWPSNEYFNFPSLDARGVQWVEATGLPTILKVTANPLRNATSFQGLRHVLFTVAGLLAFQNTSTSLPAKDSSSPSLLGSHLNNDGKQAIPEPGRNGTGNIGSTPFTRSIAAWERTKGVRMDISIRPMSLSLASGQVVAVFDVDTITGIFEWNKLVVTGVQLHTAVSVPKVSLSFMRLPTSDFSYADTRPDEKKTSLSVVLERSRVDLLKTQKDLTHTFIFRVDIFLVSGQIRPWKLLFDAAVWADEQEFVSDLQSINYKSLSSSHSRDPRHLTIKEPARSLEHRVVLLGANVQRFMLAVPLLNSEQNQSSRLALRATELHLFARQRFDGLHAPIRNIVEVKSHFIGVLWENSSLLSSHHARITLGIRPPSLGSNAHVGVLDVIIIPGTWRICPRKDVVLAILEAKNRKDNKRIASKSNVLLGENSETHSMSEGTAADSVSNATEKQSRLLVETLQLKILRTSGFIEGLEGSDGKSHGSKSDDPREKKQNAKMSVPAFSISVVRSPDRDFDLIDVDFSGREGEFPRSCIQQVSNLFSDLFGAVASDQASFGNTAAYEPREISRNMSVLIRFGRSLYRAQEGANFSLESKFGLFAGKSSALLVSLTTDPVIEGRECSHTTVISGASPKLALEITPLLEGAQVQSLRLVDARFLHGLCPCHPPHTLLHISRVTALMEAKTVLLTQNRLKLRDPGSVPPSFNAPKVTSLSDLAGAERSMMFVLGKPRARRKSIESPGAIEMQREMRTEPDIRLQVKLKTNTDNDGNQIDLCVERIHVGVNRIRKNSQTPELPQSIHGALHEAFLRGQWEKLSCKLRLRENLLCFNSSGIPPSLGGTSSVANIMNRLYFESLQYDRHTLKLDVDAMAASWCAPRREVVFESTTVNAEMSHTLQNALVKLLWQVKKLRNQVKLVTDKELGRLTKRSGSVGSLSHESWTLESSGRGLSRRRERGELLDLGSSGSASSGISAPMLQGRRVMGAADRTTVSIRGDELVVCMRGYQFEESQHSAVVSVEKYGVLYRYDFDEKNGESRQLDVDFEGMRFSYKEHERGIHSDLCRIPSPKLQLSMCDTEDGLEVVLVGDLEVKLGHGFYYWKEFKDLLELTVQGIVPRGGIEGEHAGSAGDTLPRAELWDGQEPHITVRLNPRIDVIGPDLTSDMLQMSRARLGNVEHTIPKHMYDYVVIPLEAFSKALCDPLFQ